jgi:hypothetical protein
MSGYGLPRCDELTGSCRRAGEGAGASPAHPPPHPPPPSTAAEPIRLAHTISLPGTPTNLSAQHEENL